MCKTSGNIVDNLWNKNVSPNTYSKNGKYQDHLLEQYKIYVEMADKISERRNLANTFFLTLNTFITGTLGFLYEKWPTFTNKWFMVFPMLGILTLCYTWWRLVKSYRQLNTAKYKVLGEFETRLPTSPYWSAEWKALGEGKDPKLYVPLTHIENWVPIIFGVLYILGFVLYLTSS